MNLLPPLIAFTWNDLLPLLMLKGPVALALIAWFGLAMVQRRMREQARENAPDMPETQPADVAAESAVTSS